MHPGLSSARHHSLSELRFHIKYLRAATMDQSSTRWTVTKIRNIVEDKFDKRPCWLQIQIALALYAGKDVIACAATGAGKTLSFWIPLLMALEDGRDRMSIVVTPLNLLGKQNVKDLEKAGLTAIAVSGENVNADTFMVSPGPRRVTGATENCLHVFQDIEDGKYNVVIINPELLMGSREVETLWRKPKVTKRLLNFIFDQGHCITQWGKFRDEYRLVGLLRYLIPETIPFYAASATFHQSVLQDVSEVLHLRHGKTEHIIQSNDQPEIGLMARSLVFPAKSFRDLAFLIPDDFKEGDPPPPKFLIFFDNTKEAERAARYLRRCLPLSLQENIKYFHSTMTSHYRENELDALQDSCTWALCATDAFGMVRCLVTSVLESFTHSLIIGDGPS